MTIGVDNTSANAKGMGGEGFDAIMAIDVARGSYDEGIWEPIPSLNPS